MQGFGQAGQQQSRRYAWQACIICKAPIRVSMFLCVSILYQLAGAFKGGFKPWFFLQVCGQQAILILTVLCHEFGHGTMSRAIGGEIDHILLWPFGGICFSSRPSGVTDPNVILKNDLKVVAAGPSTHFLMAPAFALLLCGFGDAMSSSCAPYDSCTSCVGTACVWPFLNPFATKPHAILGNDGPLMGEPAALLWALLATGLQMNVSLFLFNVFFPMYPADGSKLLVCFLMYCCGVPARRAAMTLVVCTTFCAILLIGYAVHSMSAAAHGSMAVRNPLSVSSMMGGIMVLMGVMSLVEAHRIYGLIEQKRLHTHPLFQTARSWGRRRRDAHGVVHEVNQTDADDSDELVIPRVSPESWCCCCSTGTPEASEALDQFDDGSAYAGAGLQLPPTGEGGSVAQRERRQNFLQRMEADQAHRTKTVRELEEERLARS